MILYPFTLAQVAIALGLLYLVTHGILLWKFESGKQIMLSIHRNQILGTIIFCLAVAWFLCLIKGVDLMEWTPNRTGFLIAIFVVAGLAVLYLPEYLGVRGVGILLLLSTKLLLDSTVDANLHGQTSRLLIVCLAYIYAIIGIFIGACPYLWRDALALFYRNTTVARIGLAAGCAFGILLLALGLFVY